MAQQPFRMPLVDFPPDALAEIIEWLTPARLAALIDVTDLRADTQEPKIHTLVEWATRYGCCSVCVNPVEVDLLPTLLRDTPVKECYVVDFPLGKSAIQTKAHQAVQTVAQSRAQRGQGPGWVELDMVINVGRFKRDPAYTQREIAAVVEAADGETVKVIIRSSELLDEEICAACQVAQEAGARFVKNSTGMEAFGATPDHIRLMRDTVGPRLGVKAAGGIREAMGVVRLIYAGALEPGLRVPERFRIGTSSPLDILSGLDRLRQDPRAAAETATLPCALCPSGFAERLSPPMQQQYLERCGRCPYQARRQELKEQ